MQKLLLLVLASLASANKCWPYVCSRSPNPDGVCALARPQNSTYLLSKCPSETPYCPTPPTQTNATCHAAPSKESYPGELCSNDADCVYGTCSSGKCSGLARSEACRSTSQCGPNLRCADGECAPLLGVGDSGCRSDSDCVYYAGCNDVGGGGVCVRYFTLEAGATTSSCQSGAPGGGQGSYSYLCESGVCLRSQIFGLMGTCSAGAQSSGMLPQECDTSNTCRGTVDGRTYLSTCECGVNSEGKSYCGLFQGDPAYLVYLNELEDFLRGNAKRCNSDRRFSEDCWRSVGGDDLFAAYYSYAHYPQLVGNTDCIKSVMLAEYYGSAAALLLSLGVLALL